MAKIVLILLITSAIAIKESRALECYHCEEPCEVSKASKINCGRIIENLYEPVCITRFTKGKDDTTAERKCWFIRKNKDPDCDPSLECKFCKTDLCNSAPSIAGSNAIIGVVSLYFITKFLLN